MVIKQKKKSADTDENKGLSEIQEPGTRHRSLKLSIYYVCNFVDI